MARNNKAARLLTRPSWTTRSSASPTAPTTHLTTTGSGIFARLWSATAHSPYTPHFHAVRPSSLPPPVFPPAVAYMVLVGSFRDTFGHDGLRAQDRAALFVLHSVHPPVLPVQTLPHTPEVSSMAMASPPLMHSLDILSGSPFKHIRP